MCGVWSLCLFPGSGLLQPAVCRPAEHGRGSDRVSAEELQPALPRQQEVPGSLWPGEPRPHHPDLQTVRLVAAPLKPFVGPHCLSTVASLTARVGEETVGDLCLND